MRIIKRGALVEFWERHPDARASLESWYTVVRHAGWKTPAEMKRIYPSADIVGRRTVFNIAGNKYRLVARVNYETARVFVLYILTHAEYDRGGGKHEQHNDRTRPEGLWPTLAPGASAGDPHRARL